MKRRNKKPIEMFSLNKTTTGQLIKSWRENFAVSQDFMAFACGISQANLSAIENDRRDIGSRVALRLSSFMSVAPDIILYPNGFEKEPEYKEVQNRKRKLTKIA